MKRFCMLSVLFLFVFVTTATAGPVEAVTVAEAKVSSVDTGVVLTGQVVKVINENSFLFSDGTGELLVHVNGDMLDKEVMMKAEIDVAGRIVQDFMYTEVQAECVALHN